MLNFGPDSHKGHFTSDITGALTAASVPSEARISCNIKAFGLDLVTKTKNLQTFRKMLTVYKTFKIQLYAVMLQH